jgi:hypothetical protein
MTDEVDRKRHHFLAVAAVVTVGAGIFLVFIKEMRSRNMDTHAHVMHSYIHA